MDYSKYIEMKMEAANTYKSKWQPRDASEVTLRNQALANAIPPIMHVGTKDTCCKRAASPIGGFTTTYSADSLALKAAGCVYSADSNWGKSGGVSLLTCNEVSTILTAPDNPNGTTSCYCADPGMKFYQRGAQFCANSNITPGYTGWRNHVPTEGGRGYTPVQYPLLPSQ